MCDRKFKTHANVMFTQREGELIMAKPGKRYVIADTHFNHANICKFLDSDGNKLRPWNDVNEMNEALIENWNRVVKPEDTVYILGDVAMNRTGLQLIARCNSNNKILIKGNHCNEKLKYYVDLFTDIRAVDAKYMFGCHFVMTHCPIHPGSIERWGLNICGHLHNNYVKLPDGTPDLRYYVASVERINYTPKLIEEILHERHLL